MRERLPTVCLRGRFDVEAGEGAVEPSGLAVDLPRVVYADPETALEALKPVVGKAKEGARVSESVWAHGTGRASEVHRGHWHDATLGSLGAGGLTPV